MVKQSDEKNIMVTSGNDIKPSVGSGAGLGTGTGSPGSGTGGSGGGGKFT